MQLKVLFVVYCCTLCVNFVQADVTCTVGNVVSGSPGSVQCDFGTDVKKDKHNFNVVRYDFNLSLQSRTNLLVCNWRNDQLDCPVKETGYLFDNRVDSTLTLTIPVVDKSMTGLYRCQLVPKPPDTDMHFCNLTVIETSISSHTTTANTNDSPLIDKSKSPSDGSWQTAVIILAVMLVLSVLSLIVCGGLLLYLRRSFVRKANLCKWLPCFKTQGDSERDEETPLQDKLSPVTVGTQSELHETTSVSTQSHLEMVSVSTQADVPMSVFSAIRVIMLGKTAAGKSSLGNTLCGQEYFKVNGGLHSDTPVCQKISCQRGVDWLEIIDSPGVLHTHLSDDDVHKEVIKSLPLASPGPHIFLYVMRCAQRFTQQEYRAYTNLKELLSEEMKRYLIVVFNAMDSLEYDYDCSIAEQRDHVLMFSGHFATVLSEASQRYMGMNNKADRATRSQQADDLVALIKETVAQNGGMDKFYTKPS